MFMHMSTHMSNRMFTHLSLYVTVRMSIHMPVHMSKHVSMRMHRYLGFFLDGNDLVGGVKDMPWGYLADWGKVP